MLFVGYKGMSVEQFYDLRGRLRKKGSRLQVVKNSVLTHAARELNWEGGAVGVDGPMAVIFGSGDVIEITKLIMDFGAGNKKLPVPKGGRLGKLVLSVADVEALSKMPAREIILGQVVGTVAAPLTRLVGVLNQKVLSLLYVLKAVEEKKSKAS